MQNGKVQFTSERYQLLIEIFADMLDTTEQNAMEGALLAGFREMVKDHPDSLSSMVASYFEEDEVIADLISAICKRYGPKIMVGVGPNGMQLPTLIGIDEQMELLPLTSDCVGLLIAGLRVHGYDNVGRFGKYYVYEKGEK